MMLFGISEGRKVIMIKGNNISINMRILSVCLIIIFTVLLFSGCGGGYDDKKLDGMIKKSCLDAKDGIRYANKPPTDIEWEVEDTLSLGGHSKSVESDEVEGLEKVGDTYIFTSNEVVFKMWSVGSYLVPDGWRMMSLQGSRVDSAFNDYKHVPTNYDPSTSDPCTFDPIKAILGSLMEQWGYEWDGKDGDPETEELLALYTKCVRASGGFYEELAFKDKRVTKKNVTISMSNKINDAPDAATGVTAFEIVFIFSDRAFPLSERSEE
jgi:hypothetical protein